MKQQVLQTQNILKEECYSAKRRKDIMFTFEDILKSSFLENVSEFSALDAVLALTCSFALGMLIYMVYKKTFSGVMYSKPFNTSLVLLTMLTTLVILAVTTNVVLSLGMVGALSIVRFRTAIKDPLDLVFLFWSLGTGIILGAGMLPLALLGSVIISVVLLLFNAEKAGDMPYVLMMDLENEISELNVSDIVDKKIKKIKLKSKTVSNGQIELIYEVRINSSQTGFINELSALEGVKNAVLVSYNGEYSA